MGEIGWPIEHPHDKRACVVCDMRPVVLKPSAEADAGLCARCRAPYTFKEPGPDGLILPQFQSAIPTELLDLARAAWGKKIRICFAPYVVDETTSPTDFEAFLQKHGQTELAALEAGPIAGVEVWTTIETGHGIGWLRVLPLPEGPEHQGATEHGVIALDADELPIGTTITINRPGAEG